MQDPTSDLLKKTLKSDSPEIGVEALIREQPNLSEAIGKSWANGFGRDDIPPAIARYLIANGAPLSVHAGMSPDVDFYVDLCRQRGEALELGCGTGRVLIAAAEAGCTVTGLQRIRRSAFAANSPEMIFAAARI